MTFKDYANEITLIFDLMSIIVFMGLFLFNLMPFFFLFIFTIAHILMKFFAMRGWKKSNEGWAGTLKAWKNTINKNKKITDNILLFSKDRVKFTRLKKCDVCHKVKKVAHECEDCYTKGIIKLIEGVVDND